MQHAGGFDLVFSVVGWSLEQRWYHTADDRTVMSYVNDEKALYHESA